MSTDIATVVAHRTEALALPDYIKKGDVRGSENIQNTDIRFPALKLAQSTTPETKSHKAEFIAGLHEGELFNSVSREVYGDAAIQFVIVNQLGHRNVEFDPGDRNIVIDGNVPDNDPRCEFTEKILDGKKIRVNPVAVRFYDYLLLALIGNREPTLLTLSLKKTQLKKAVGLNSVIKLSKLPAFAHLFTGKPVPESRGDNSWYGWRFDQAGWPTEDLFNLASRYYDQYANRVITVETEPEVESEVDPEKIPF